MHYVHLKKLQRKLRMKTIENIKIVTDLDAFNDRVDEIVDPGLYEAVKSCVSNLKKALYANKDVPALCAPQIGQHLRLFVVKTAKSEDDRFKIFLNPMIVTSEGYHLSRERSASIPDKEFIIPRRNKIHVAYQSETGEVDSQTFIGAYAEVIQQMVEMLDGITLADYGLDLDDIGGIAAFDKAPKKQKAEVVALYLDSIKEISKELRDEIDADPTLKYLDNTINFMTGVLKGDITPDIEEKKETPEEKKEEATDAV